jgi:hypothetical protein
MQHKADKGFLTIAQNTNDVNYLELAYLQALNIKVTQPNSLYAVIVDELTQSQITDTQRRAFDYVITLKQDNAKDANWKLSNEWQIFWLTPFKETIKLESDLLFTRDISHWWQALRLRNVVLSYGVVDYQQRHSTNRNYRKLFDYNNMPDVYNGMMYFRYSKEASEFFTLAKEIYKNWDSIRDFGLTNVRDEHPTTDVVYGIVSTMVDQEPYIPSLDFFRFAHMKPGIQGWAETVKVFDSVHVENDLAEMRINNVLQLYPVHYHDKNFIVKDLINQYENQL